MEFDEEDELQQFSDYDEFDEEEEQLLHSEDTPVDAPSDTDIPIKIRAPTVAEIPDINYNLWLQERRKLQAKGVLEKGNKNKNKRKVTKRVEVTRKRTKHTSTLPRKKKRKSDSDISSDEASEANESETEIDKEGYESDRIKRRKRERSPSLERVVRLKEEEILNKSVAAYQAQINQNMMDTREVCWMAYLGICNNLDKMTGNPTGFAKHLQSDETIKKAFDQVITSNSHRLPSISDNAPMYLIGLTALMYFGSKSAANQISNNRIEAPDNAIITNPPLPPPTQKPAVAVVVNDNDALANVLKGDPLGKQHGV